MENNLLYRPLWMCGRYDDASKSAICYNLAAGVAYFFKDESAEVMSIFLRLPRNGYVTLEQVEEQTGISKESIGAFAHTLVSIGILSHNKKTSMEADAYRQHLKEVKQSQENKEFSPFIEKREDYSTELNDAERAYKDRVGGLFSAMFELTYNCSAKCIHCYNIGATRNDEEVSHRNIGVALTLSDYKRIIDQLYEEGLVKVCLSGGDPFSNINVWEILDYLYQKGIAVDIYTNGISIVEQTKRLADYFPRLVGISLYSGDKSDHESITRIKGSFSKTVSTIERFAQLAVPMVLKCCIMRPNLKSYYTVKALGDKYGLLVQYELNVTNSVEGDKCVSTYLRLQPNELEVVLRDPSTAMYVGEDVENYGGVSLEQGQNLCGAGKGTFCITPNGEMIPCCAFHLILGDLKVQSVKDVLQGGEALKQWLTTAVAEYEQCGKHDYCDFCNCCAGYNYSETGDYRKVSTDNCSIAKVRYCLARRMKENGYDPLGGKTLKEKLEEFSQPNIGDIRRIYQTNNNQKKVQNVDK